MVCCSETQMACEYATIEGGCSLRACAKLLFTAGGLPIERTKQQYITLPQIEEDGGADNG